MRRFSSASRQAEEQAQPTTNRQTGAPVSAFDSTWAQKRGLGGEARKHIKRTHIHNLVLG
jgi:hypothetical protein